MQRGGRIPVFVAVATLTDRAPLAAGRGANPSDAPVTPESRFETVRRGLDKPRAIEEPQGRSVPLPWPPTTP
jgi:hypothetical protein